MSINGNAEAWTSSVKYDKVIQLFIACARTRIPVSIASKRDVEEGAGDDAITSEYIQRILCRNIFHMERCRESAGNEVAEYFLRAFWPEFLYAERLPIDIASNTTSPALPKMRTPPSSHISAADLVVAGTVAPAVNPVIGLVEGQNVILAEADVR